jgi:hypothetical protein
MRRGFDMRAIGLVLAAACAICAFAPSGFAQSTKPSAPATTQVSISTVRQEMIGTWQNTGDTRFTRELDANGRAFDRVLGEEGDSVPGMWTLFVGGAPPKKFAGLKLDPGGVFLEIDRDGDTYIYQLVRVSRSDMQMVDLEQKVMIGYTRLD